MKNLFRVPFTMLLAKVLLLVPIVAHAGEGSRTNVPASPALAS